MDSNTAAICWSTLCSEQCRVCFSIFRFSFMAGSKDAEIKMWSIESTFKNSVCHIIMEVLPPPKLKRNLQSCSLTLSLCPVWYNWLCNWLCKIRMLKNVLQLSAGVSLYRFCVYINVYIYIYTVYMTEGGKKQRKCWRRGIRWVSDNNTVVVLSMEEPFHHSCCLLLSFPSFLLSLFPLELLEH